MCDRVPSRSQPRPRLRGGTPNPGAWLLNLIQLAIRGLHPRAASAVWSLTPCRTHLVLLKHAELPDHPERADWPARVVCWVTFELVFILGGRREPQPKQ